MDYEGGKRMKFRKKPVVIDAILYDGSDRSQDEVVAFIGSRGFFVDAKADEESGVSSNIPDRSIGILTLEGTMYARPGDWIIRGTKGEFYPCKPDIFVDIYEAVDAP